jgi:hypothetical protein
MSIARRNKRSIINMPKSVKERDEKYLARYNSQYEKYCAMTLQELNIIRTTAKLSKTDAFALKNAIYHLENPANKQHIEMADKTNAYDLQADVKVDNVVSVRYPTDDFTYCAIGAKDITGNCVNEKYMPAILTDWWFEYLKFEKKERWEKKAPNGMLFYSEMKDGFLQCLTDTEPQLASNYVHQLQNNWMDGCGVPLIDMHRTLDKSLTI